MTTVYANLNFVTPPENQGQIVETAYAVDADREQIVCRSFDRSDCSESYAVTTLGNLRGEFEPWNRRPCFHDDGLWEPID